MPDMPAFKVVLVEHGYASTEYERRIICEAGGEFIDAGKLPVSEALRLCETAEGVMVRRVEVTPELIRRFQRCKCIVRYGIGTDNVHLDAATAAGIIVTHVPDYCVDEVSAHTVALWLACVRKIVSTHKRVEQGAWDVHRDDPIHRTAGKTFGLVGLGKIGQAVAQKLNGWDLRLLATDPFADPAKAAALGVELVDVETLCRESDIVSMHCPLLPETRHLLSRPQFEWMKADAVVLNTARGPVVNTQALLAALESDRLAAAGLDVFEEEPLPTGSPLRRHPRVVVTDHTAWYSEESQIQLQISAAEEVVRACTGGLPRAIANPQVLLRLGRAAEWTPVETARWQLKRLEKLGLWPG
jgi:D-3-phosphoglycerate dehydrogenase